MTLETGATDPPDGALRVGVLESELGQFYVGIGTAGETEPHAYEPSEALEVARAIREAAAHVVQKRLNTTEKDS